MKVFVREIDKNILTAIYTYYALPNAQKTNASKKVFSILA